MGLPHTYQSALTGPSPSPQAFSISLKEEDGRSTKLAVSKNGTFRFPTKAGMTYQIQP